MWFGSVIWAVWMLAEAEISQRCKTAIALVSFMQLTDGLQEEFVGSGMSRGCITRGNEYKWWPWEEIFKFGWPLQILNLVENDK